MTFTETCSCVWLSTGQEPSKTLRPDTHNWPPFLILRPGAGTILKGSQISNGQSINSPMLLLSNENQKVKTGMEKINKSTTLRTSDHQTPKLKRQASNWEKTYANI